MFRWLVIAALAIPATARADEAKVSTQRRIAAVTVAIVPGIVVRGAGAWLVGERRTAKRLAAMAAIGIGGAAIGGGPVGISGGYPPTVPLVPILIAGAGLAFTSWWADIAVAAGLREAGVPLAPAPWAFELATVWQHDAHRERGFLRAGARVDFDRIGLGGSAMIDAENQLRIGEGETRVRILGARPTGTVVTSGSRLSARIGVRASDDEDDRVSMVTGEVEVIGRLDLVRIDRALRGSFLQLSTGVGVERTRYPNAVADTNSVLLGTFAWGTYLGERGEASLYYDHRRDSLQGGIAAFRAAGFVGSVGAYADVLVAPRLAIRAQFDLGSSYLATVGFRYQGGPR